LAAHARAVTVGLDADGLAVGVSGGLDPVDNRTPWEELRRGRLARSPANVRLLPDGSSARPRRARIAFSDSTAKQLETITGVTALRTVVVVACTEAEMRWLGKVAAA
jgi:hypothetical protein